MGYLMNKRHYRVPLSYDLTFFQILGQKFVKFLIGILVQPMTPKGHFEINWPLPQTWYLLSCSSKMSDNHEYEKQS